jgi:ABC-type branched-subunit amino acid transport system substrate-binding protein
MPIFSTQKAGLEGHPIEIVVQDHGNEPQRGIECYERLKREGVMVFDTLSTPVSRAVLPRIMKDGNILIQSLVGSWRCGRWQRFQMGIPDRTDLLGPGRQ